MPIEVSEAALTHAKNQAVACVEAAFCFPGNLAMPWACLGMEPEATREQKLEEFHVFASGEFAKLAGLHTAAYEAMPREVLELVGVANATHGNLPGVAVGSERYATAHEAARAMLEGMLSEALQAIIPLLDCDSAQAFIQDLGRLGEKDAGGRLQAGLRGLEVDRQALWRGILAAVKKAPAPDLTADVEREWMTAVSLVRGETRAAGEIDDSAWVDAVALWKDRFPTYKKLAPLRKRHPEMFRKSGRFKLEIHAGKWTAYWASRDKAGFDALGGCSYKMMFMLTEPYTHIGRCVARKRPSDRSLVSRRES